MEEKQTEWGAFYLFFFKRHIYRHISDIASFIPDHCSKVSVTIKRVIIFLPVEGLAFKLYKTTFVKHSKVKCCMTPYACRRTELSYLSLIAAIFIGRVMVVESDNLYFVVHTLFSNFLQ